MSPNRPDIGEVQLPGMADITQPVRDLSSRNAFARAVTPEYWGLDSSQYVDIDSHMLDLAAPANLRESLIDVPKGSQFAVSYIPGQESRPVFIALTPTEYSLVVRHVPALAMAAISHTLASRRGRKNYTTDIKAATRSGVYALENRKKAMETYLRDTLERDTALLNRLAEAAKHPGYWRMPESDMRIGLSWVLESVFGDMLTAIRYQRQWTPEQESLAKRTIEKRLFFERQRNQHIQNWRDMFSLDLEYIGNKEALFKDRIWKAGKTIAQKNDSKEK
jgi:hypothetical protein